jgi:DNA-directed RNA polymerase subunit omega
VIERADQRQLVKQVGGVFKLCSLIQKRMRELVMGARPLVELDEEDRGDLLSIVLHEIQEGKVTAAEEDEVAVDFEFTRNEPAGLVDSIDLDELKSVVADEDIEIVLPGEEDQGEEEEETGHPEPHPTEAPAPAHDREHELGAEDESVATEPADDDLPAEAAGADDDDEDEDEEEEDEGDDE